MFQTGSVKNDVLHLEENKHAVEYYLQRIRCTDAHQKKLIKENFAKQDFNGKQNLAVDLEIPQNIFGKLLLDELNVPVVTKLITDENGLDNMQILIPCQLDDNLLCDVLHCDQPHKSSRQEIQERFPYGYPEDVTALLCRCLQGVVQSLVTNIFGKLTEHHHLQTRFDEDGSMHLIGNAWIKELTPYNETGELLTDMDIIPNFFTDTLNAKLVQAKTEMLSLEDTERITENTRIHLNMEDWEPMRESTLGDFICLSGRGFKSVWTDHWDHEH